ncbi:hypothetical protein BGS_0943 [Beggiatoa sp. SS]|nr:hypothetical protein BGS_0943 [Beggiatoa sp. SS]
MFGLKKQLIGSFPQKQCPSPPVFLKITLLPGANLSQKRPTFSGNFMYFLKQDNPPQPGPPGEWKANFSRLFHLHGPTTCSNLA